MARRATFPRVTAPMVTVAQRGVGVSRLCSPYSPCAAPGDSASPAREAERGCVVTTAIEHDPVAAAQAQLDAWEPDEDEPATWDDVFHAIYERWPEDDEDVLDLIYAARDHLTPDEARGVLHILWPTWPGFDA